ncbi:oxidative stress-induced growth inhibitor 1-like [Gigantopelta aegis]|uniref:oxidative stress-induced growth inhibitor 1-like n=1 Tax=Gigantopelta aegis TaxID=1735272 RepID=UPI001B88E6F6|nr:oxidative stress-induced growth inhibitor 1-like [Gigantopelta aegis]XP_041377117.1 oxidative stress-induced growth inhibitor 1-like [Gigantopelta aegis]XP_041377118.1 oxidative stress-induced growth inhibitor 1-like [Gigantopelta aegis]XP_041377119.1 oxidative stress-induced growth inhibitor 1-like [Gigantopelta aegis]XP_041377120.1 oxidative stress-induced growth inhibitor 1-like [Gigantopelta aegis]
MSAGCCTRSDAVHTDVVVVGNGPSAISLSFFLSGNRPYYNGHPHSHDYIVNKLQNAKGQSLVDQDLMFLSEGLEGRSPNPVALLFDALCHPDADQGGDSPSLLTWKKEPHHHIPHVVLGKTRPGGSWQKMDGTMQTISQNTWMELPTVPFREWLNKKQRSAGLSLTRATVADVKDYYSEFVKEKGLSENFRDFHTVTSIRKVFQVKNHADSESGEIEPCCVNFKQKHGFLWEVRGYSINTTNNNIIIDDVENPSETGQPHREDFCYISTNVVLATGTYDIPNKLSIPGETLPCVVHSYADYERMVQRGDFSSACDPVVVIGAGLSAADAVLMSVAAEIPVLHVIRRNATDPNLIYNKLPRSVYPEYHHILSLIKGEAECEFYRPCPRQQVVEIKEDGKVLMRAVDGDIITTIDTSLVVVLIGSRSDLSFLPNDGRNLGIVPKYPIDSTHNPIDVDPLSYQSVHEPNLFAVGPLVADNFVRFGIGGALGVTSYLHKRKST